MEKSGGEIKKAAFAGSWYPESPEECTRNIGKFLQEGREKILNGPFSGGVVPHAGWYFSGSIACGVIASIAAYPLLSGRNVNAVVIFGMHMNPDSRPCVMVNSGWRTPLGELFVHGELAQSFAKKVDIRQDSPLGFPQDNTIELQLPFVKYFFKDAAILPVGVPPSEQAEIMGNTVVASARELGLNIVVLASTDMTHYGDNFGFSPAGSGTRALKWVTDYNDRGAIETMTSMDPGAIISHGLANRSMCCAGAAAAAVSAAREMGAVGGVEFDYATSYDKSPGESFVGYSGILFSHYRLAKFTPCVRDSCGLKRQGTRKQTKVINKCTPSRP
ncbi:MAG: AmmeMemoRadiSam system protein B [Desulfamplus sp.]|nr:AmmeMemoRadiSam system protein B [Desulfamplus sp.]